MSKLPRLFLIWAFLPSPVAGEDLIMHFNFGVTGLSVPAVVKEYWHEGVNFRAAIGTEITPTWAFNIGLTHHTFDFRSGYEVAGEKASINLLMLRFERRTADRQPAFYFAGAAGLALLRTPSVFVRSSPQEPPFQPKNLCAQALQTAGAAVEASFGTDFSLNRRSGLFGETFLSTASTHPRLLIGGIRAGIRFAI